MEERFSWTRDRQTTYKEDKAYSLLGMFDICMPLLYGEGEEKAFQRLRKKITKLSKDQECIQHLRLTDPRDDKKRIEDTKGGLLEDSYHWILENPNFQQWRDDEQNQLLWIKGDPGKGKTMLLCGIINELIKSMPKTDQLSYFFCQATDSRINSATAVLRGLLYLLVDQQPSLNALSKIFTDILQDPSLNSTSLIINALNKCVADLPKLLDFIWIVSSRNWPDIEERLERAGHKVKLCLELNAESVSTAVGIFIQHKVLRLAEEKRYNNKTRDAVALVCQNLKNISRRKILAKLNAFPPGLGSLYERIMQQIWDLDNAEDVEICKRILGLTAIVYQPVTLQELTSLVDILKYIADDLKSLREIISLCGSFLTIQGDTVYFVHQSAKEFLIKNVLDGIFPSRTEEVHYEIFSRSLQVMSRTLRQDMYGLGALGYPTEQIKAPDPDPLAASSAEDKVDLQDGGAVDSFLRHQYLYWLEALSLCKSMSKGVVLIAKLEVLIKRRANASALNELVRDARRFIMAHKLAIENSPLQSYASALVFSPTQSIIRGLFKREEPNWITIEPAMQEKWNACLQTLEGHSHYVSSVAFSPDSTRLASGGHGRVWICNVERNKLNAS
ncbi:uncharacterized protein BDR25DRAFT_328447 [Lindgomyces ingoldianus]|uniref:Uncharacterized protein n=1 Tax=Lindgomyces ingoldianus TaxID=673940 RepID=A0ACB6QFP8_9PLEO|nr:uncharacterized protein BDR25DRAFT_328447 [Lindgomyces ingoldianus]KAF2465751.1 hypothetical protein BDR25DRAFT_328447 [Lindgomyces ingoldianus]